LSRYHNDDDDDDDDDDDGGGGDVSVGSCGGVVLVRW